MKIDATNTRKLLNEKLSEIKLFSPFELVKSEFAFSTSDLSFKVAQITNLNEVDKTTNPITCVIQNLINRGSNVTTHNKGVDSLLLTVLLELFKRKYKVNAIEILVNARIKDSIDNTKKELNEYIAIFSKVTKKFPSDMVAFIENIKITHSEEVNCLSVIVASTSEVIMQFDEIKMSKAHLPPSFLSQDKVQYKSIMKNKNEINSILKLVFFNDVTKIQKLKDEQLSSLDLILNKGENILAVLKTGFGKSLIYQFAAILQPVIFLNIFPINSLIMDQAISISSEMNLKFAISNEELKSRSSTSLHKKLLSTKRMFLVTPERLENKEMQDYFLSLGKMVGFMIFDEAHCISEWGHDFRPSYLMARHLMENLTRNNNLRVIALTATAAPHIQKDVAKLLQIKKENIVNIADSSGLYRKEISYKFIKYEINDFDKWNRSPKFTKIIDKHISSSLKTSKQGIAFFMKAGDARDNEKKKYLMKINAYSAFKRLDKKTSIGLYTGTNKFIETTGKKIPSSNFSDFLSLDYIISTKSFGMGINLKKCDYVLLTEPPYSLEDLYQQSGRAGRMGQESVVEILYHDRSLLNPLDEQSPYSFFLSVSKKRKDSQMRILNSLVRLIFSEKTDFILDVPKFLGIQTGDEQNYLKWAIAHLITEFNLVEKYYIKYSGFKIGTIGIYINKDMDEIQFIEHINTINKQLGILESSSTISEALAKYYEYYFDKLQNDKLIGINILQSRLLNAKGEIGDDVIYGVLTDYYRTRMDEVDIIADKAMKKMFDGESLSVILETFSSSKKVINKFELMEAVSRYSSTKEYIEVGSLMINFLFNEKILITNKETIIQKEYTNTYLADLRDELLYLIYFEKESEDANFEHEKEIIMQSKRWKKINELHVKKKILEELNG